MDNMPFIKLQSTKTNFLYMLFQKIRYIFYTLFRIVVFDITFSSLSGLNIMNILKNSIAALVA